MISAEESERLIEVAEELVFRPRQVSRRRRVCARIRPSIGQHPKDAETLYGRIAFLSHLSLRDGEIRRRLAIVLHVPICGQQFRPHLDGDRRVIVLTLNSSLRVPKNGMFAFMLLYLNGLKEGVQGGDTLLMEAGRVVERVMPRRGRALFFRYGIHPLSVLHAGDVLGEVPRSM